MMYSTRRCLVFLLFIGYPELREGEREGIKTASERDHLCPLFIEISLLLEDCSWLISSSPWFWFWNMDL